jgi:hypothetical protein
LLPLGSKLAGAFLSGLSLRWGSLRGKGAPKRSSSGVLDACWSKFILFLREILGKAHTGKRHFKKFSVTTTFKFKINLIRNNLNVSSIQSNYQ